MTARAPGLTGPALWRLEAERWPDGTFGGARRRPKDRTTHSNGEPRQPDPLAAQHLAELAEAIAYRITPRQGAAA